MSTGSYTVNIPSFNKENFVYNNEDGVLFVAQWQSIRNINESSISLSNIKYNTITKAELFDLDIVVYQLN